MNIIYTNSVEYKNESSQERKLTRTKAHKNESSQERKLTRTKAHNLTKHASD
jgi:hypothetical protein